MGDTTDSSLDADSDHECFPISVAERTIRNQSGTGYRLSLNPFTKLSEYWGTHGNMLRDKPREWIKWLTCWLKLPVLLCLNLSWKDQWSYAIEILCSLHVTYCTTNDVFTISWVNCRSRLLWVKDYPPNIYTSWPSQWFERLIYLGHFQVNWIDSIPRQTFTS